MPTTEERYPPSELAKFYRYDPETGFIWWKPREAGMTFGSIEVTRLGAALANGKCAGKRAEYKHI
jgi:hypothetical protein